MQDISLEKLSLIGYDKINQSDEKEKTVHFFLDDYRFESIYKTFDITKCITFDPTVYSVNAIQESNAEEEEEEKQN